MEASEQRDVELSESEYRTGSEFQPDFHSDHEPPEDKLAEAKLVVKMNNVRVYKKIIKLGSGLNMPSKCDKIVYKLLETDEESLNLRLLDGLPVQHSQLGCLR